MSSVGTFGYERFSDIINPYLAAFAASNRPREQRISQVRLWVGNMILVIFDFDTDHTK